MLMTSICRVILLMAARELARAVWVYALAATLMAVYGGPPAATLFLSLAAVMCYAGTRVIDWVEQT